MVGSTQSITQPHGVTVFGSSVVRTDPDYATVDFAIAADNEKAGPALHAARNAASGVSGFLKRLGISETEYRSSRPDVIEFGGDTGFAGYRARIRFNVTISDLDLVENVVTGVVDGGATNLRLSYRTKAIRDARAEAQQAAVLAAFKRADLFAEAAGIKLGRVLHVEDVDPERLEREGDDLSEIDHFNTSGAYDPGSVVVRAAVRVSFSIKGAGTPEVTGTFTSFG